MNGKSLETRSEKEQFWRNMFQSHAEGKGTVRELCNSYGVSIPSYYQWKRKLAKSAPPDPTLSFAEFRVVPDDAGAIEVRLQNGRALRVTQGFDEETLLRLIALLESVHC